MELDGRLRDKLIGTLRNLLPTLGLSDAGRLDMTSAFDADEQFSAALRGAPNALKQQIDSYIGERPLFSILTGTLTDELRNIPTAAKMGKRRLCDLEQYQDVERLATHYVDMLAAMPREYLASIDLPSSITRELHRIGAEPIIGQHLSVIGSWNENTPGFPARPTPATSERPQTTGFLRNPWPVAGQSMLRDVFTHGQPAPPAPVEPPVDARSFLYVRLKGYIHPYYPAPLLDRLTTLFKAFFGLGMGMELFEDGRWDPFNVGPVSVKLFERSAEGFIGLEDVSADDSAGDLFRRIRLHAGGRRRLTQDLRGLVQILEMDEAAPQLMLAGRWLFDSRANRDAVMGFMQLAICAEVLLGTEDGGEGVTSMLASRCAYLIATNTKERDALAAEFKNLYKVRSKIVHRGLGAFKENERQQYRRLRTICNRIVQKEIELTLANGAAQQQAARLAHALRKGATVLSDAQRDNP